MHYKLFGWLIVAMGCGVVCSFAVKAMFFGGKVEQVHVTNGRTIQVLVAKTELSPGTELGPQNIRFDLVPEDKIPRDAIFSYDGIQGRKVIDRIARNKPISLFDLEMKVETTTDNVSFIPPGFSVVPIRIENVTSGGTFSNLAPLLKLEEIVLPGDKVTLSVLQENRDAKRTEGADKPGTTPSRKIISKPLVENVSIYSVQSELTPSDDDQLKRQPIVSLLLDSEKTNQIKLAMREGKLRMTLVEGGTATKGAASGRQSVEPTAPIAVNILSGLGHFRTRDNAKPVTGTATTPVITDKVTNEPTQAPLKTAGDLPKNNSPAVKKPVIVQSPSREATARSGATVVPSPANAPSNKAFSINPELKKQKDVPTVEASKEAEKAPQDKERIQESQNGFRARPGTNNDAAPREKQMTRQVVPARGVPAVVAPRSGLSVATSIERVSDNLVP